MATRLPPLNALKAFESAARHLSVKRAAAELNVTPAAVSHQIKALEDYLGVQLFLRHNRALELTEAARAALPKLREGFDSLAQAVERLRAHKGMGQLTVSAAPSFAARWLMPQAAPLLRGAPGNRRAGIRAPAATGRRRPRRGSRSARRSMPGSPIPTWRSLYGRGDYPGFRVDKLLPLTITPICSPKLITDREHPLLWPRDLKHHLLLHDDTGELYDGVPFWEVWLKAAGVTDIDVHARPAFQPRRARVRSGGGGTRRRRHHADARRSRPERGAAGHAVRAARAAGVGLLPGVQRRRRRRGRQSRRSGRGCWRKRRKTRKLRDGYSVTGEA